MKIVAIVGSLRKDSFNMQLVKTIEKRYSHLFKVEIADIGNFPYYNEDDEKYTFGRSDRIYKKMIAEADAVLISTPEFNWSMLRCFEKCIGMASRVDQVR